MTDFIIKDSGKRQEFGSGMVRDIQTNKLRYDLALDGPLMFEALRRHFPTYVPLLNAVQKWYEHGTVGFAADVMDELCLITEGGFSTLLDNYTRHLEKGAVKYSERNWMKANSGEEADRFRASFGRHIKQVVFGDIDEDHKSAVIFNMNGREYVLARLKAAQPS